MVKCVRGGSIYIRAGQVHSRRIQTIVLCVSVRIEDEINEGQRLLRGFDDGCSPEQLSTILRSLVARWFNAQGLKREILGECCVGQRECNNCYKGHYNNKNH